VERRDERARRGVGIKALHLTENPTQTKATKEGQRRGDKHVTRSIATYGDGTGGASFIKGGPSEKGQRVKMWERSGSKSGN